MCGILGLFDSEKIQTSKFESLLSHLYHRGPDFQSAFQINTQTIFGHTRLSIIDLDQRSNQPFSIEGYIITYNGEVYNYVELRCELEKLEINFITNSDTEVILRAYMLWGEECVSKFNGMWAFTIYDPVKNILFSSRDRFGIKPFYYYYSDGKFMFSSMIFPIISYYPKLKKPNYRMINEFLYRGYMNQFEETWFEEIKRLKPGYNLIYDFKNIFLKKYYHKNFKTRKVKFQNAKEKFLELFNSSVKLRMRSDVGVSSTLTSGLDSSSIVCMVNKDFDEVLNTYTVYSETSSFTRHDKRDFKENIDLDESKSLKYFEDKNIRSQCIKIDYDDYFSQLKHCIRFIESGHAAPAIVGINKLYKSVRVKNGKVLLEGQGADEVFGGYITDFVSEIVKSYILDIRYISSFLSRMNKIYSPKIIFFRYLNAFKKNKYLALLKIKLSNNRITKKTDFVNVKYYNLFDFFQKETLPNLLLYGDALSMANSIETRFPFLDYRLVDFGNSLPINYKINFEKGKYIIRESMRGIIPEAIYESKIKNGFGTPIDHILKHSKEIKDFLYQKEEYNFFDHEKLVKLLDMYYTKNSSNHSFIFKILTTKIWFSIFFESNKNN